MLKIINIILFCFIVPTVMLIEPIKEIIKNKNIKGIWKDYKWHFILYLIFVVGSLVRLVGIDKMPNALNVDEASTGYEAYSLMKYGIDRRGNSYPVYLYAWGSGQSVLYSYLSIPAIAIFGLSEYSIRLPMAIIGIISLYAFYFLLKNGSDNKKIPIIGAAFFAICPWHIMKSRWGLECNLFPDLVLIGLSIFYYGIKEKKNIFQVIGIIIIALSGYSYSTSYVFLPIFVIGLLIYLVVKKEISIKKAILYFLIVFIVCIPIMLYVIINMFDLEQFKILNITIPKLKHNRYTEATIIGEGSNIIENIFINLYYFVYMIVFQGDSIYWNSLPIYGMIYIPSVLFFTIGLLKSLVGKEYKNKLLSKIMNIWMLASIVLAAISFVNVNRMNIVVIPCVYYAVIGLYESLKKDKAISVIITLIYIALFGFFLKEYNSIDFDKEIWFTSNFKQVYEYCEEQNVSKIYCLRRFSEPYIYFLFYGQKDVHEYIDTVELFDEKEYFNNVKSFSKYYFYGPEKIERNSIMIMTLKDNIPEERIDGDYNIEEKVIGNFKIYTIR